jgi:hypothetical protein
MKRQSALLGAIIVLASGFQAHAEVVLQKNAVSAGGRAVTSSAYELNWTLGQGVAASIAGSSLAMEIGYWPNVGTAVSAIPEMPGYIWSLDQNHPNPFNPVTTISFTLAADSQVRLEVYSIRGRRIRSLLNESRGAGPHKVIWDGRDSSGRQVASGTYFARIVSDQGTLTKKMMLMK